MCGRILGEDALGVDERDVAPGVFVGGVGGDVANHLWRELSAEFAGHLGLLQGAGSADVPGPHLGHVVRKGRGAVAEHCEEPADVLGYGGVGLCFNS